MNHDLEIKLQAFVDGELSPVEAAQVRELLADNPEAAALLGELKFTKAALAGNDQTISVPDSREFYWSKIERQIRHEERSSPAPLPWAVRLRRFLAPLAGVAALAAVLVLTVHQPVPATALDVVSTADGVEARTIRDQDHGMTIVFLQDTKLAEAAPARPQPARTRDDGSSFFVDVE